MINIENHVGRLVETRGRGLVTDAELVPFRARMAGVMHGIAGRAVVCMDFRELSVTSPSVIELGAAMLRADNAKLERAGLMVGATGMVAVQMARMLAEAANPQRQLFREPAALLAWLDEVLTPAERARLRLFVAE